MLNLSRGKQAKRVCTHNSLFNKKLGLKKHHKKDSGTSKLIYGNNQHNQKSLFKKPYSKNYDNKLLSPSDKRKTNGELFSITEVIVNSELNGKIDTTNWLNQANIITP